MAVISLAKYGDEHSIYINEHIVLQYMTLMMGVEDIYYIENEDEKEQEIQRVWKHLRDTKNMIRKESGIEELDKLFKSITHAKHKSEIIDYFSKLQRERRKQDKQL